MKIAIMAIVAILVLCGGAGGAYFYFGQKAEASVGETEEHTAAKEDHGKKEGKAEHLAFVEMDPLILPIIDAEGINQLVSLVIVLQVHDEEQKAEVSAQMFRIKDAYIQDMYGSLNKHVAVKDGVIQVDVLKAKLTAASERVLGEGVVTDVLLQVVQQRPI